MDEEDAMKSVTRKEKKIRSKSKKGEKNVEALMGTQQSQNISHVDGTEHVCASGEDGIAEMKKDLKKNKANKTKKSKQVESGIKKDSEQGELTVAYGENRGGDPKDNVERKMKRSEKSKTGQTKEDEENERENGESVSKTKNTKDASKERNKKHKVKRKLKDVDFEEGEIDAKVVGQHIQKCKRKKMKQKKKSKDDSSLLQQKNVLDENEHERKKKKDKKKYNNENGLMHTNEIQIDEVEYANKKKPQKKKKKKYTQLTERGSDDLLDNGVECEEKEIIKKTKPVEKGLNDASPNKSNKKIRFSSQDKVLPIPCNSNTEKENVRGDGLIRGKWFSPEEDETIKAAVAHYIEKNDLGNEGLDMVLNCKKYPKVKGCWKEICTSIPCRPHKAVYYRAQCIFRRSEIRKWTQDEYDLLRSYQKEHGNKWKAIAKELGKHDLHVRRTWDRIKVNRNKGHWSQDEYQKLFNLVNLDLQAKLSEDKKSQHGMLRDNICWTAISEVLTSRSMERCCEKWYRQLTSRMVVAGVWADKDDYCLIDALYRLDATCVEDVDWDVLLENRTGDLCRKRWNQMALHIGYHGNKSFSEQVEVMAERYCPILLEARETWDSKPRVG